MSALEVTPIDPPAAAEARFLLGRALWAAGDRAEAIAAVESARADAHAAPPGTADVAELDAWLAAPARFEARAR